MGVRFILGRASTGKTWHCLASIQLLLSDAPVGPPIFWILPRQATFQAERTLTARLGAFTRVRVVSFEELGQQILDACGDVGIPELTPLGRRLIIAHLLRTHEKSLRFYGPSARRPGLAAELDATFGEFDRAGVDGPGLDHILNSPDLAPSLRDKLSDVHLLMQAYGKYANQQRLDPQQRMLRVLDRVENCRLLKDAVLFVDDFFDFSANEQKLLVDAARIARRADVTLLIDPASPVLADPHQLPAELSLFHRTERTYRSLYIALSQANVAIEPPLVLHETRRFESPALAGVERNFFGVPGNLAAGDAVQWIVAPDARTEVDTVARRIRDAARRGLRWRDIAVLVRGIDAYQSMIDASFAEHGIAFFVDRRQSAVHHPLLQFTRGILLVARQLWPHDAVMMVLKSGLAGVTDAQADTLENYVLKHRLRGAAWTAERPWTYQRRLTQDAEATPASDPAETVDTLRRELAAKLAPLIEMLRGGNARAMSDFLAALSATLESFSVRSTIARWMRQAEHDQDPQQRNEYGQVWQNLADLLSQMNDLLGPELISPADFVSAVESGLERFDLATPPPTLDAVLVGQVDRTRTPDLKMVVVLGLNEGSFPASADEDCVLSDPDRRMLQKQAVELDADSGRRLLDERLLAYRAFTAASQQLIVSRPEADGKGRPTNPSSIWRSLSAMFPDAEVTHEPRASACDPNTLSTPRQLVTALMRWARSPAELCPPGVTDAPWSALYQWLARYDCRDDAIDRMRFRAWRSLGYDNRASLSGSTTSELFASPLQASVGQIETFAACPFKHFARHGLRLERREAANVTRLDLSQAYHQVLEELVQGVVNRNEDWCSLDAEELQTRIHQLAGRVGKSLRGELMLSTARNQYLLERIETTLRDVVAGQCEMHGRGRFRPAFAGLRFGPKDKLPPHRVQTPQGRTAELFGRIDRVDLQTAGDAFSVFDYRFAAGPFPLDRVFHGLNLQLLVYILVVQEGAASLLGRPLQPAAAFLLGVLRSPQLVEHPDEAKGPEDPDFHLRVKPRGVIRERAIADFDQNLAASGNSPVVQVRLTKEGQVGWRGSSDVASDAEFAGLLQLADRRIGELADRIMDGDIEVKPYWLNQKTPCATCDYRSVCRFEPGINGYRVLPGMRRDQVLVQIGGEPHGE